MHNHLSTIIGLFLAFFTLSCNSGNGKIEHTPHNDTLRIGTLYSPYGFMIVQGDTIGYQFERIQRLARHTKRPVSVVAANSLNTLRSMLLNHQIDLIASQVPETAEFNKDLAYCGHITASYQVLVQRKSTHSITKVTELIGKPVYVEQNTRYEERLRNLNSELGAGIHIYAISNDTLITEDLVEQVAKKQIDYTIADSQLAEYLSTYYPDIDATTPISFKQQTSWAVRPSDTTLQHTINLWSQEQQEQAYDRQSRTKYLTRSKLHNTHTQSQHLPQAYTHLFKKYAAQYKLDYRLLIAICAQESEFNPKATSWAGAQGLMQIMPNIARAHGVSPTQLSDPETNIRLACELLRSIDAFLDQNIPYEPDRLPFIIAAYNCGIGHVSDAIALARKYGKNPKLWHANVQTAMLWKANPTYYNQPICRYGYYQGRITVKYVDQVLNNYHALRITNHLK